MLLKEFNEKEKRLKKQYEKEIESQLEDQKIMLLKEFKEKENQWKEYSEQENEKRKDSIDHYSSSEEHYVKNRNETKHKRKHSHCKIKLTIKSGLGNEAPITLYVDKSKNREFSMEPIFSDKKSPTSKINVKYDKNHDNAGEIYENASGMKILYNNGQKRKNIKCNVIDE